MSNILKFIATYDASKRESIQPDWDDEIRGHRMDRNHTFRQAVIEQVIPRLDTAPLALIRDLYLAETDFSVQPSSIHPCVSALAETLLERGGETYLRDYLRGHVQSGHSPLTTAFQLNSDTARDLIDAIDRIIAEVEDEEEKRRLKMGRDTFSRQTYPREKA